MHDFINPLTLPIPLIVLKNLALKPLPWGFHRLSFLCNRYNRSDFQLTLYLKNNIILQKINKIIRNYFLDIITAYPILLLSKSSVGPRGTSTLISPVFQLHQSFFTQNPSFLHTSNRQRIKKFLKKHSDQYMEPNLKKIKQKAINQINSFQSILKAYCS